METTLKLQNIKYGGCTNSINAKLLELSWIHDLRVSAANSEVSFSYETVNDLGIASHTLTHKGYPAEGNDNKLLSKAKPFVSCATGKINI
jgi:copper chaperone